MLLLGRQRQRTCQTLTRRAFLQAGGSTRARPVAGRPAPRSSGRPSSSADGQLGHPALALGRAGPARHLGPQAERPARIPRPLRAHRHAGRPASASASCSRSSPALADQLRHPPLAAHRLQRPRRRRHHRPDRQRRRRRRPRRQGRCRRGRGRRPAPSWPGRAASQVDAAAVPGRRRQAAPGQEGHHRRRRRPARRPLRPVPPGIRPRPRHAHPRPAAARRPDARAPRRPPDAAAALRPGCSRRRRAARGRRARRLPRPGVRHADLARRPRRCSTCRQEPAASRDRYGRTRFGQSCLLARRLVEHGVPFVQVNWSDHVEAEEDSGDGGWDHHYRNFQIMQDRHAPWLDQALSALLDDLHERGLLETTLVVAVGEFGRSPKINDKAGRDHWEHCYSALLAGGGVARRPGGRRQRRPRRAAPRPAADARRPGRHRPPRASASPASRRHAGPRRRRQGASRNCSHDPPGAGCPDVCCMPLSSRYRSSGRRGARPAPSHPRRRLQAAPRMVARRQEVPLHAHPRGQDGPVDHERRRHRPQAAARPPSTPHFDGHWSPDGKKIVFVLDILQGTDGKLQINTVNADGTDNKVLIPQQGVRGVAALVARRQAHRLGQHARRQPGDLHRRRRGQEHAAADQRGRPRQQPELVARRQAARLRQRPHRQLRDSRHERRRRRTSAG